ncbi:MAG TPA: long-chain fatty acid--CoA ligase [Mycobacteriales bacterium]|nr:long-chain fatty acid--CoA ligase [Mycobacteriales bacterium]
MPESQISAEHPSASTSIVRGDTILEALEINAQMAPDEPAMRHRTDTGWQVITWSDYATRVREVAAGLTDLGIGPGEHVGVLSANRPEWHLADLGALAGGRVTVPLYLTSSPAQIAYILNHTEARLCFVDSHEQLGKLLQIRDQIPKLDRIVLMDRSRRMNDVFITGFAELRALGSARLEREPSAYDAGAATVTPDSVATIVYTSGTTGPPKGAVITHRNLMWVLQNTLPAFDIERGERLISFLPLSHIAERMVSEFLPIGIGGETWFARSLATVVEDLPACRPTLFLAVPRVWEKLQEGIGQKIAALPLPLRMTMRRYMALGRQKVAREQDAAGFPAYAQAQYLALDRLLGAQLRSQLGLDRAHVLITTAAPIHPDLIRWFHAIGLPVAEFYGQTENCGPTSSNRPRANRIGTVGQALPGVEVRIAEDDEILMRGGNVCSGYHRDPEATAALIDAEGWMHTGDLGVMDADGFLRVTGRKKDLIITAAGKNIAPQDMEVELRHHPLISQALVLGEGERYLAALICLDPEQVIAWARERGKLQDTEALAGDPDVMAEVQAAIDEVNRRRSHAEWIRKFRILARDLTVEGGELTPTMKVKRSEVYKEYADVIEEMYAESL